MATIYHITTLAEWEQARAIGLYAPDSLKQEGFIHGSTAAQVERVANSFYLGRAGLVLLAVDTDRLSAPLKWEAPTDPVPPGTAPDARFPHVYGPINVDAVARVVDFPAGEGGRFTLPAGIA